MSREQFRKHLNSYTSSPSHTYSHSSSHPLQASLPCPSRSLRYGVPWHAHCHRVRNITTGTYTSGLPGCLYWTARCHLEFHPTTAQLTRPGFPTHQKKQTLGQQNLGIFDACVDDRVSGIPLHFGKLSNTWGTCGSVSGSKSDIRTLEKAVRGRLRYNGMAAIRIHFQELGSLGSDAERCCRTCARSLGALPPRGS